jgi:hypothetical protein
MFSMELFSLELLDRGAEWYYYSFATDLVAYRNVEALKKSGLCTDRCQAFGGASQRSFLERF